MAQLETREVSYIYPGSTQLALDHISCLLESGKMVALLGANGCGKSTLAKLMAGIINPYKGSVLVNDRELTAGWNGIGLLFQNPDEQLLTANVERELAWGLENLALPTQQIEDRVRHGLEVFGLNELRLRPPESLSDGEKQLVALAALFVMQPDFLILDEATAFLDPEWTEKILTMARKWSHEIGVLWVTTQADNVVGVDEVWLMASGKIIASGNSREILDRKMLRQVGVEGLI